MHNSHAQHSHRRRWQPSGLASRVAIHVPLWRRPTRSRLFQEPHQSWLLPRVHTCTAGGTQGLDSADPEIEKIGERDLSLPWHEREGRIWGNAGTGDFC